jgi:hypothetical protein
MATSATNSYTGKGIAESFEDIIFDISPEDTPLLSMAKRMSAGQTYHQWQTDALAAAATLTAAGVAAGMRAPARTASEESKSQQELKPGDTPPAALVSWANVQWEQQQRKQQY